MSDSIDYRCRCSGTICAHCDKCSKCALEYQKQLPIEIHVRFKRNVDREPNFTVQAGATGVITKFTGVSPVKSSLFLAVRLDEPLEGAEEWDNEVQWMDDLVYDIEDDIEVVSADKVAGLQALRSRIKELENDLQRGLRS